MTKIAQTATEAVKKSKPHYIGVDVSKEDLFISNPHPDGLSDLSSAKKYVQRLSNDYLTIEAWLATQSPEIVVVFETTGVYSRKLEYCLSNKSISFIKLNGLCIKRFSESMGHTTKNDTNDAIYIRQYAECRNLQSSAPINAQDIEKERYLQVIAHIDKQIQSIENQIHILDNDAIELADVRRFYEEQLAELSLQKESFKQKISSFDTAQQQEVKELIMTVKGIGYTIATALCHAFGDFSTFKNPKQVAKAIGINPVTEKSGTSVNRKRGISKRGNKKIRSLLYMGALSAMKYNPACKEKAIELRARGKSFKVTCIAIVNKLLRQIFAVVKSGKKFDETYHLNLNDA